jgi:hypothetical protein
VGDAAADPVPTDSVSRTAANEMTPLSHDLVRAHVIDNSGGAQLDLSGRTVIVGSGMNQEPPRPAAADPDLSGVFLS